MKASIKKNRAALCIAVMAVLLLVMASISSVAAAEPNGGWEPVEWVELLLEILEPLIGAEACALLAALLYAFLGKWANHEAWSWEKFEPTLKVALVNGVLFTLLNIVTGWSFASIEIWVLEVAGLYVMQKFLEAIGPYFAPIFGKQEPG